MGAKQRKNDDKPISGIFEGLMLHLRGGRLVVLTVRGMLKAVEKEAKQLAFYLSKDRFF